MGNSSSKEVMQKSVDQSFTYVLPKFMQNLEYLEEIIFNLNEINIYESISATMNVIIDDGIHNFSNLILSQLIYSAIVLQMNNFKLYINFMKQIENKEKEFNISNNELINRFKNFLLNIDSQESYFILERMIELGMVSSKTVDNKNNFYFAHHFPNKPTNVLKVQYESYNYHDESYEELSKNDFERHKKYVKEGVNSSKISKIIRNDEIEKLQEISSQSNFNFNQSIKLSLYERYSFINQDDIALID